MTTGREIAKAAPSNSALALGHEGFEVKSLEQAIQFAQQLIDGGVVPYGMTKPGAVVAVMQAARELGLPTMYGLANLTFTNGRLGIMGDAAKALIRARGLLEPGTDFEASYSGKEGTAEWTCTVSATPRGLSKVSSSFSLGDAIRAGLAKIDDKGRVLGRAKGAWSDYAPWSTYTKRMLMYRALGFLARDYFGGALGGAVLTEELRDYPREAGPVLPDRGMAPPVDPDPLLADAQRTEPEGDVIDAEYDEASNDDPSAEEARGGESGPGSAEESAATNGEGAQPEPDAAGDPLHAETVEAARNALRTAGAKNQAEVKGMLEAAGISRDRIEACHERMDTGARVLVLHDFTTDELQLVIDTLEGR